MATPWARVERPTRRGGRWPQDIRDFYEAVRLTLENGNAVRISIRGGGSGAQRTLSRIRSAMWYARKRGQLPAHVVKSARVTGAVVVWLEPKRGREPHEASTTAD